MLVSFAQYYTNRNLENTRWHLNFYFYTTQPKASISSWFEYSQKIFSVKKKKKQRNHKILIRYIVPIYLAFLFCALSFLSLFVGINTAVNHTLLHSIYRLNRISQKCARTHAQYALNTHQLHCGITIVSIATSRL